MDQPKKKLNLFKRLAIGGMVLVTLFVLWASFLYRSPKASWIATLPALAAQAICYSGKEIYQDCFSRDFKTCVGELSQAFQGCLRDMDAEIPDPLPPPYWRNALRKKISVCAIRSYFKNPKAQLEPGPLCQQSKDNAGL